MNPHLRNVSLVALGALLGITVSQLPIPAHAQATVPPAAAAQPTAGRSLLGPATPSETAGAPAPRPNQKIPVDSQVISVASLIARNSGVGTRRDLFDGPTRTLVNLEGHISTLNPGNLSHEPHQHTNEELILLTKGKLEVGINNKITTAVAGDLLFFASNDWHNVKSIGTEPAEYYVLNWASTPKPGYTPPKIDPPTIFPRATPGANTGASR